jgi:hypothetical protein
VDVNDCPTKGALRAVEPARHPRRFDVQDLGDCLPWHRVHERSVPEAGHVDRDLPDLGLVRGIIVRRSGFWIEDHSHLLM